MPHRDFTDLYNTGLDAKTERSFQDWMKGQSAATGRDVSKDLKDYDLRGWWQQQQRYDFWAKENPEASHPVSFMRAGAYVPIGELSSAPSENIDDRRERPGPFASEPVPRDPSMATSEMAKDLGIENIRR